MDHAGEVERKMYRESLQNNREIIELSKKLATIHTNVPVECELKALAVQDPDPGALREICRSLEFNTLLRELAPEPKPAAARDYQQLASEAELDAWLPTVPAG